MEMEALIHFQFEIWKKWKELGIEYVNIIPVDNALADPFDAESVGSCHSSKVDTVLKGIVRQSKDEKVGVVGNMNGQLRVVEYTELPENEKNAVDVDGTLRCKIANTGLFTFRMDFIEGLAKNPHFFLPWHLAQKSAEVMLSTSKGYFKEKVKIWKCESFFFDVLNFTSQGSKVLVYPREEIYAPLKNATGSHSLEELQKTLQDADRQTFMKVTGKELPPGTFELDPAFYYPTPALLEKWRGRDPAPGYVEA
jgi:UDP-N-acetylglucosamine/UDP-N-acetylgalactosamine diphosphorylase